MSHGGTERELNINQDGSQECNRSQQLAIPNGSDLLAPGLRGHQCDDNHQGEESLRQTGMKNSDLILQHGNAQTTEDSLQDHGADRSEGQHAHPAARFCTPKPHCKNDGEHSYGGGDQTVGMLEKNPANPF